MATAAKNKPKPKLPDLQEATVAEQVEAATEYLTEKFSGLKTEELRERMQGIQRDYREVVEDLSLSQASLEDALAKDFSELDEKVADDPEAQIAAKHYDKERERLGRQVVKRERLKKLLMETQLAYKLRQHQEYQQRSQELHRELEPLWKEQRDLEERINRLNGARADAAALARENTPSKTEIADLFAAQKPDLSNLRQFISYK